MGMAWPQLEKAKHKHKHVAKERAGDQKTHGDVTSRQTSSKQEMAGNNWRGLPKTGGAGEMLWMAYAPGGLKGLS
ncbi:hypothetical protein LSAT2_032870, partial [Lamellibrachia satsuma]